MPIQLDHESPPETVPLLRGIVDDVQTLVQQQLTLLQVEVKNDARRTVKAAVPLIVGGLVSFIAVIILAITAAQAIHWAWPQLHPVVGYGIVGAALAIIGIACVLIGKARFQSFNPLPDKTLEGLKENLQWKKKT